MRHCGAAFRRSAGVWFSLGIGLLACGAAQGDPWTPEAHTGSATVVYQFAHSQYHLSSTGQKLDVGTTNTQSVYTHINYDITDYAAVYVGLPWIKKQYNGNLLHDIEDAQGNIHVSKEDDGKYRDGLQDLTLGFQYRFDWGDWAVTPFAAYTTPTHNYPQFTHAALGLNQEKLELGFEAGRLLPAPLTPVYVQIGYGYSFLEKFAGVRISLSTLTLETGYVATDRLVLRVFAVGQKTHGGLDDEDFAYLFGGRTDHDRDLWFHHHQTSRVDFIEGGIGATYAIGEQTSVFGLCYRTLWGEGGHATQYALGFGISRQF